MRLNLHVLSVGFPESSNVVREALLLRQRCRLFVVAGAWDLSTILASETVDVAVLHDSLAKGEIRRCAGYIRRHCPTARIILMHSQPEVLDDPLYDEQVSPQLSPDELLPTIEQIASCGSKGTSPGFSRGRTKLNSESQRNDV